MLETRNLKKVYKTKKGVSVTALNDVSIKFPEKGLVFLLGKSGSGKSTLLNLLGGLDKYDEGEIIIKGVSSKDFKQSHFDSYRNTYVGFIFQEYNVLEEFSVGANIALAIELQGKKATDEEINRILKQVDLEGFGDRKPNELSGGQKRRVAIAGVLAMQPEVLLFDEPLSNLDAKLRESMRDELRALQKRLGITSLYVTHDQSEAMAISDRVVIMKDGVICQQGTPTEIYEQPNSRFVANFIGKANFIDGTFRGMDGENALVEVGGHTFPIPAPGKMEGVQKDGPCCLAVRPESILLSEEEGPLPGRVSRATYYGAKVEYEVMLGDQPIIVEVYNPQLSKRFAEGEAVHMTLIDRCVRVLA